MKKINVLIFGWILSIPLIQPILAEDCILTYKSNGNGYTVTGATNKSTCTKADIPSIYNGQPVTEIQNYAFYETLLEEVNIPDSITSIGGHAFYHAKNLTTVIVPTSVTSIGNMAFYDWYLSNGKDKRIYCPEGLDCHIDSSIDLIYYTKSGDTYVRNGQSYETFEDMEKSLCPEGHQCWRCGTTREACTGDFDPETGKLIVTGNGEMTKIPWDGIRGQIKSAEINGVKNIANYAFMETLLEDVSISDSITSIGEYAFYHAKNLTTVIVPTSVTSIGNKAFYDWYLSNGKDKRIYCPEGVNCTTDGGISKNPYSKIGDYYSMNGKMYRNLENMLKGIEMKRIYTVNEANDIVSQKEGNNTFSIRYR